MTPARTELSVDRSQHRHIHTWGALLRTGTQWSLHSGVLTGPSSELWAAMTALYTLKLTNVTVALDHQYDAAVLKAAGLRAQYLNRTHPRIRAAHHMARHAAALAAGHADKARQNRTWAEQIAAFTETHQPAGTAWAGPNTKRGHLHMTTRKANGNVTAQCGPALLLLPWPEHTTPQQQAEAFMKIFRTQGFHIRGWTGPAGPPPPLH